MKKIVFVVLIIFSLTSCNEDENDRQPLPSNSAPIVNNDSTYAVLVDSNLVYAEGLSHDAPNSNEYTIIPLRLDIYTPDNESTNRPLYMFIHGGGFVGGTKSQEAIVDFAHYYTSRGWVFVSIDYRLRDDIGTLPMEWLTFSSNVPQDDVGQFLAIYPAQRDAKAALRWIVRNANAYGINTKYITVGGGSAGAITSVTLGVSEHEDFTNEISLSQDPTLATTNVNQTYTVSTIIDFWGSKVALDGLEQVFGHQRFDGFDPPLLIIHGTLDTVVPFGQALALKSIYEENGLPFAYYPLEGVDHGEWSATVDGVTFDKVVFDFIVQQQNLIVE